MDYNNFTSEIIDDSGEIFPVEIEYDFVTGFTKTTVPSFEWIFEAGKPNMSKIDIENEIKRLIKIEENTTVEFI